MSAKILLIEDDKDLVDIYKMKFGMEGFNFVFSYTGNEGLVLAEKEKPNLIFLDIILFEQNGLDVLKQLKKNPNTKEIPVILLTNLTKKTIAEDGKKLGAIDYVIKTNVSLKELVQIAKKNTQTN
jgi:DNA-binding response OmpR family regulator